MQFNLVIDQEQVVHCVWHGVALALGVISILGGCLQRLKRGRVLVRVVLSEGIFRQF